MITSKFDDYHQADWQQWQSKYLQTAKIFYNSVSNPMTAQQAAQMHQGALRPLSSLHL